MAGSSNFWTPQLIRDFHQSVGQLRSLTETPGAAQYYRDGQASQSTAHLISSQDELQIADDLAFLSHWNEGAHGVSTVTLQEQPAGLVILLASNTTPSENIVQGLEDIAEILSKYAEQRKGRLAFSGRLFDRVLQLSEKRVLARIKPSWVQQPSYIRGGRPFLGDQLNQSVKVLKQYLITKPLLKPLLQRIEELVLSMEPLRQEVISTKRQPIFRNIIVKCAEAAKAGDARSVEDHLKSLGLPSKVYEATEIRQVDKLARYLFLCKNLIRVSRKEAYRDLLSHIRVSHLKARSAGYSRQGARQTCHVHAEIQQVMHYQQHPHQPAPRAIGCSKSACYLCDLFITTQNRYHVSHSHRRLYDRWTLPDVNWMTDSQVQDFRTILRSMVQILRAAASEHKARPYSRPFPLESRAFLPLSSGSSLSEATLAKTRISDSASSSHEAMGIMPIVKVPSLVQITHSDLPFTRYLHTEQTPVNIEIDILSLSFELIRISSIQLSIKRTQASSATALRTINVFKIPTDKEMKLKCSEHSAWLGFCLQLNNCFSVDVEIFWDVDR